MLMQQSHAQLISREASWSYLHAQQGSSVFTHQSSETIFAVMYVFDETSRRVSRSLLRWTGVVDAATGAVVMSRSGDDGWRRAGRRSVLPYT